VCLSHPSEINGLLSTRSINTNEVGRSALVGPALTEAARQMGGPLGLVDVGCSAGLNLHCDRYFLDYGSFGHTGPAGAAVKLRCEVVGGRPPIEPTLPNIAARIGIDLHPVDATDADELRWQLACVWPDTGRLARTRLALQEVAGDPPEIVEGDAVDAIGPVARRLPAGATAVVLTTWSFSYLPIERRALFDEQLIALGEERPVAWISMDAPGVIERLPGVPSARDGIEPSVLGLTIFDARGPRAQELAFVHPHGNWLAWHT
jgi:hypothetical protein